MTQTITILLLLFSQTIVYSQLILSHNDYNQEIPLHTAMKLDSKIIEADIYLYNKSIVVCHDKDEIKDSPTLEEMYLIPLQNYNSKDLIGKIIMLDIKEYSPEIMTSILDIQEKYRLLFKKISFLISGDYDRIKIGSNPIYSSLLLDGRIEHIESNIPSSKMPIISMKITDIVKWNGCRNINQKQARTLESIIATIHQTGKKVRFWNVKDRPQAWNVLKALHVDVIGVDNLDMAKEHFSHSNY